MLLKRYCIVMVVLLALMFMTGCTLILSNYGVTTDKLESVFAKEIPPGTEKKQVDSFIELYSKKYLKDANIYDELTPYKMGYSEPNDEKIRDKKNLIKSTTALIIPQVGWSKVNSTYIHVTFYYDNEDRLVGYTMYKAVYG